jgi:hypothetical protein
MMKETLREKKIHKSYWKCGLLLQTMLLSMLMLFELLLLMKDFESLEKKETTKNERKLMWLSLRSLKI